MNRRDLLAWISRGLASCVAGVIGIPGLQYLLSGSNSKLNDESEFARLVRVKDLPVGKPVVVHVTGQQQDAWVRHDRQVLGRVFLVRQSDSGNAPADISTAQVKAMSTVCPHMGCQVKAQGGDKGFHCPCHRATFGLDGARQPDPQTGERNHAPRNLDELECRVAKDETMGEWWVEVKYQKFKTGLEHRTVLT